MTKKKNNFKVILADDDFINSRIIKAFLEKQNYSIEYVINGAQLVNKLKRSAYDLVLLDWLMPEMDGLASAKAIRNELKLFDLPIIILTNKMADFITEKDFDGLGITKFLPKPIVPGILMLSIEEIRRGLLNKIQAKP